MKLNADQIKAIEDRHNVCIDAEHGFYHPTGDMDTETGWLPIPQGWIEELNA